MYVLAIQVMESRGWKPSCPPRVPDEELTTPYVDWEETEDMTDSRGANSSPPEELHRCILPSVAVADHGGGISGAIGSSACDVPTMVAPLQQDSRNSSTPSSGRASQAWDLHWSYTKWAVETMRFARKLAPWQKVNHFRNSNELCRKVLWADCALTDTSPGSKMLSTYRGRARSALFTNGGQDT